MMPTLILLRHAKAEPSGPTDFDRELARRGEQQAAIVAQSLSSHGLLPAAVLCSAALRTRQTWAHIAAGLPGGEDIVVEYLPELYSATPDVVRAAVQDRGAESAANAVLLVVGHEPIMSMTAATYAGEGSDQGAALTVRSGLPTAAMARIDLASWDAPTGVLREVLRA